MGELSIWVVVTLVVVAVFAGWLDALIGGGGLIQVPALLLLAPGLGPAGAVGTSKLAAIMGTTYAVWRFQGMGLIRWQLALTLGGVTALGGAAGSAVLIVLPPDAYTVLLMIVLVLCPVGILCRNRIFAAPRGHAVAARPGTPMRWLMWAVPAGLLLGIYDGLVGPGTGTWIVYVLGYFAVMPIVAASANAKVVNVFTYLGPLAVLWTSGNVALLVGLGMGAGNVVGAHYGVRFARTASDAVLSRLLLLCVGILFVSLLIKLV